MKDILDMKHTEVTEDAHIPCNLHSTYSSFPALHFFIFTLKVADPD